MPSVEAIRERFLRATGTAYPRTQALLGHPRLLQLLLDLDAVSQTVPPRIDRFRRTELLAWDKFTSSWQAWDTVSGHRVHLVTGAWKPPQRRGVLPWKPVSAGVWVTPPIELSFADLLPDVEDDAVLAAQVLTAAVLSLPDPHGTLSPHTVVRSGGRWTVSGVPGGEVEEGCAAVARIARLLGDEAEALAELEEAPMIAPDTVMWMLRASFATRLTDEVFRIRRRPIALARARRLARVREAGERLARAGRPPKGRGVVGVASDGSVAVLDGDGDVLRGGVRAHGRAELGVVWADGELDGQSVRPLLRLWSPKNAEAEARRRVVQAEIGGDDGFVEAALRFLRASAHLRVDRMLLRRG